MADFDGDISPSADEINPYEVLGVPAEATDVDIRRAYRQLALKHHPDKVPLAERDVAHKTFQDLALAYAVLGDETRRKRYDATGSTKESALDDEDFDWKAYFKTQFKEVGIEVVEQFRSQYQGSEEERRAILDAYTCSKGSLDTVFENVMASQILDDEERIREIIDKAIKNEEVEAFKSYINETTTSKKRRRKAARKEAKDAEEYAKELGVHEQLFGKAKSNGAGAESKSRKRTTKGKKTAEEDTSALEALIKSRQQNRMGHMIASLETKYGGSKGKRPLEDDKEFEAAQGRLLGRGTKRGRQ